MTTEPHQEVIDSHAKSIAAHSRIQSEARLAQVFARNGGAAVEKAVAKCRADKRYGFTVICNNCGSTNISFLEIARDGEYAGTELKCQDCKARG